MAEFVCPNGGASGAKEETAMNVIIAISRNTGSQQRQYEDPMQAPPSLQKSVVTLVNVKYSHDRGNAAEPVAFTYIPYFSPCANDNSGGRGLLAAGEPRLCQSQALKS